MPILAGHLGQSSRTVSSHFSRFSLHRRGLALTVLQVIVALLAYLLESGPNDERFEGDKLIYRS